MWFGPATRGSSSFNGTNTAPLPPLVILSRPWSKNWPKIVNSELKGGESPTSVVTFGMSRVSWAGMQPTGVVLAGGSVHGKTPGLPWVRGGNPAATTAAGLSEVWSTIRLLTVRGSESNTKPDVWL